MPAARPYSAPYAPSPKRRAERMQGFPSRGRGCSRRLSFPALKFQRGSAQGEAGPLIRNLHERAYRRRRLHARRLPTKTSNSTRRGRLALYLAVGLAAGAVIALQIDIMRVFAVGNWTHFGSLVVSLAMLGFGLTSAVMASAKSLVLPALAGRGDGRARADGAARGRGEPLYPEPEVQPDLSGLRSRPEVEAARDLPRRADAVPRRRGVPRLRVPEEQQDVRPRLFRRSRRLRPFRPGVPRRDVSVRSRST